MKSHELKLSWRARVSARILTAAILVIPITLSAQVEWTGDIDDDWFESGNWHTGNLPDDDDIVHIDITNLNLTAVRQTGAQTGQLHVGFENTGELIIENGGEVISNGRSRIARHTGSEGLVTVGGPDSRWEINERLFVGSFGTGTLIIEDGGEVANSSHGHIGSSVGSQGTVIVSDTDSSWEIGSTLFIGGAASGSLTIESGATVKSRFGSIAEGGDVIVRNPESNWTLENPTTGSSTISVSGKLEIANAGLVSVEFGSIGKFAGGKGSGTSSGLVTVSGNNSSWEVEEELIVGELDTGTLIVEDGGLVSSGLASVGLEDGVEGKVTVTGENSRWQIEHDLLVGVEGAGVLTVTDGGLIEAGGDLVFATDSELRVKADDLGSGPLIEIGGDLVLDGTVEILDAGELEEGDFTLITFSGSLTDNGMDVAGTPAGLIARIDSSVIGEIRVEVLPDGIFEDRFE